MGLILCIETSTEICSVALVKEGELIDVQEHKEGFVHASVITTLIDKLFENKDIHLQDVDAVAISDGPGSYTGLRIGTSTAKGICYALGLPLIPVNTLEALTWRAIQLYQQNNCLYIPLMDARRNEVYTAIYDAQLNCVEATHAKILTEDSFIKYAEKQKIVLFGNALEKCKTILTPKHINVSFLDTPYFSAQNLIHSALKNYPVSNTIESFKDMCYYEPYYLKEFQAKTSAKKLF